jgi:hypothetical protein
MAACNAARRARTGLSKRRIRRKKGSQTGCGPGFARPGRCRCGLPSNEFACFPQHHHPACCAGPASRLPVMHFALLVLVGAASPPLRSGGSLYRNEQGRDGRPARPWVAMQKQPNGPASRVSLPWECPAWPWEPPHRQPGAAQQPNLQRSPQNQRGYSRTFSPDFFAPSAPFCG